MRFAALLLLVVILTGLAGCAPIPAVQPPATQVPATVPPTVAATPGDAVPTSTVPGFTTHYDPVAGFAIEYPSGWYILVPDVEDRRQAQVYTASIRSVSPVAQEPRGEPIPADATAIDVTVYRTLATNFDDAVSERRNEILNSEMGTKISSEEFWTLAGGLRAVRWQLETAQAGTVAELTTFLGSNRIMVDGMGDLAQFDTIARTFRAEGPTPSASTPAAAASPGAGITYTAAPLGFSLLVPPEWEVCQDSGYSRLFCRVETAPSGPSFPRFYLTVLPSGFTNEDFSAYNFMSEEDVSALMALPVGESVATHGTPGYSTFSRLPDTTVEGLPAVVVENAKVWEGGPNVKDRRVFVKIASSTYMIGGYYETAEELAEFERVLAGVTITAR